MSNTETETMNTENITSIITAETGLTITPPVRKRKIIKKAAEPSMKEATELAEGKTLVIKEQKAEEKPNCGAGQPEPNWKQLYLELKEKTDPLLAKLEVLRLKRNESSKKSKKAQRDKAKVVKTELEERVKKLEEKVLEKEFKATLDEEVCDKCEECDEKVDEADIGKRTSFGVYCVPCNKKSYPCGVCDDYHSGEALDKHGVCPSCVAKEEEQSDTE